MREMNQDPSTNSLCESLSSLCFRFPVYVMGRVGRSSQRALCPQGLDFVSHIARICSKLGPEKKSEKEWDLLPVPGRKHMLGGLSPRSNSWVCGQSLSSFSKGTFLEKCLLATSSTSHNLQGPLQKHKGFLWLPSSKPHAVTAHQPRYQYKTQRVGRDSGGAGGGGGGIVEG